MTDAEVSSKNKRHCANPYKAKYLLSVTGFSLPSPSRK